MKLEQLTPGATLRGIVPGAAVIVVNVQWHGADALTLVYRDPAGRVADEILYRYDESRIDVLGTRASGPHADETSAHPGPHPGWHSRGYHPHLDQPGLIQSITFRLHDSVPANLLAQWCAELGIAEGDNPNDPHCAALRERVANYEDAGHGACWLRDPRIAELVQSALLHFDGQRYRLLEWCVMPNHVHVLIEIVPGHALSDVVRSWKTFTAREANRLLGRDGAFWMPDYFDRYVRDERHLAAVRRYILENPVKAGLCGAAEEWAWSSAGKGRARGPRTHG
jgi:REP element-mobilizing transposase RayT